MREHPVIGERILRPLPGLERGRRPRCATSTSAGTAAATPTAWPARRSRCASRIVLACDAYNALVSDRPYREALRPRRARAELARSAGTQFDPRVVDALLAVPGATRRRRAGATSGAEEVARALTQADEAASAGGSSASCTRSSPSRRAVGAAHRLEDVVEIAAEQALRGDRAPRRCRSRAGRSSAASCARSSTPASSAPARSACPPTRSTGSTSDDLAARAASSAARTYVASLDDADVHPIERELLERLGQAPLRRRRRHVRGPAVGRAVGDPPRRPAAVRRARRPLPAHGRRP